MKLRFAVLAFTAIAVLLAGAAIAQSGSKPSGTNVPAAQPGGSGSRPSGSGSKPSGKHAKAEKPKIIALQFYADWCPQCKALQPKLDEAMSNAADQPCLLVKLDMTDTDSRQAEYMVAALGYGNLWSDNAGKTGFVLLVNTNTKKVVGTITTNQSVSQINSTLKKALNN